MVAALLVAGHWHLWELVVLEALWGAGAAEGGHGGSKRHRGGRGEQDGERYETGRGHRGRH